MSRETLTAEERAVLRMIQQRPGLFSWDYNRDSPFCTYDALRSLLTKKLVSIGAGWCLTPAARRWVGGARQ